MVIVNGDGDRAGVGDRDGDGDGACDHDGDGGGAEDDEDGSQTHPASTPWRAISSPPLRQPKAWGWGPPEHNA